MEAPGWLWIVATIGACGMQVARNAMQRSLTARLGTLGATHVRFLFGLPFGLLLLAATAMTTGLAGIAPGPAFIAWVLAASIAQIAGTALMLAAMQERSFVVTTAYVKTEPVQVALFGFVFLGERLGTQAGLAVLLATSGVILMSMPAGIWRRREAANQAPDTLESIRSTGATVRPALLGIASGGMFALAAIGFREAILTLGPAGFQVRATVTLAAGLACQTALLTGWLLARDRRTLISIAAAWRASLLAGAAGAFASQLWFLAFALQSAAAVRTLGLLELLFAQAASRRLFAQRMTAREAIGMAMMAVGLVMLLRDG